MKPSSPPHLTGNERRLTRRQGRAFAALFSYALLLVLLRAAASIGLIGEPELLFWHGHELLLAFAPGLMGVYLVGMRMPARLRLLAAFWLAGRAGVWLAAWGGQAAWLALTLAYPAALAAAAAPAFLRRDTRWRNRLAAAPLVILVAAEFLYVAGIAAAPRLTAAGLMLAAGGVIAMMLIMGARLAAAAVNGGRQKQGYQRAMGAWDARLEFVIIGLLAAWLAAAFIGAWQPARFAAAAAASAILARIAGWRPLPALRLRRVRLLLLGLAWVAAGLFASAVVRADGLSAVLLWLHPAFSGGLAVLAATVSLQVRLQRRAPVQELPGYVEAAAALFSLGAALRMVAFAGEPRLWLPAAAFAWAAAAVMVVIRHLSGP